MFDNYFSSIQSKFLSSDGETELSYRSSLENLLNDFIADDFSRELIIKHEPSNIKGLGRPDFKVITKDYLTIGLIETKKIGENLSKILESEQLERYAKYSDNIILTDYIEFYLIKNGSPAIHISLCERSDLDNRKFKVSIDKVNELKAFFGTFFSGEPDTIAKVDDLAEKLSQKAIFLREFCRINLQESQNDENKLYMMYKVFRDTLLSDLETDYFADIYAQTLSYGLFLGGLNCNDTKKELNKYSVYSLMPNSFQLIKELFHNLDDFPKEVVWAIDEIITILKVTDFIAIKKEFAEYRNQEKGFHDPFIYFYEDFLKKYDKSQRELRGVYYTPEPVVSFIIRSIEELLKEKFNLNEGFVDKNVTVLDFACGTGTFLLNVFKQALESASRFGDKQFINRILNESLINQFYGFELMVAPYVVAHLKISEFIKEQGYSLDDSKRLGVYLTNTLLNTPPKPFAFLPYLSKESKEANRIKNEDILVIVGNPPYSVSSQNRQGFITEDKLNRYKEAVKAERNIQPLSDDYIKFIRFAHWKMESTGRGVVGLITNNSFLDGLIHRGMREELLKDFDEIYIVNLHGNSRIGEKTPEGAKDDNVFEIMQGVCISIFVKHAEKRKDKCRVFYKDLFGKKQAKYDYLWEHNIKDVDWIELKPNGGTFYFTFKDFSNIENYKEFYSISKIFNKFNMGIASGKDSEFVKFRDRQFDKKEANFVKPYYYRPFDIRKILYDKTKLQRARYNLMQHIENDNIVLALGRRTRTSSTINAALSKHFVCRHSVTDMTYAFPLYLYQENGDSDENGNGFLFKEAGKRDNFTKEFRKFIKDKYKKQYSPESVLAYIYAILHSPLYRTKYLEYLKIDFPRIPFADDAAQFEAISKLGNELMNLHLMKNLPSGSKVKIISEKANYKIEKVERKDNCVYINADTHFVSISEEVWDYTVGSYRVLDKWLKERKALDYSLGSEDVRYFISIAGIIDASIEKINEIDLNASLWL